MLKKNWKKSFEAQKSKAEKEAKKLFQQKKKEKIEREKRRAKEKFCRKLNFPEATVEWNRNLFINWKQIGGT